MLYSYKERRRLCTAICAPCRRDLFIGWIMLEYDKICDFQNLYKAHKAARLGKRHEREVIDFEMNLGERLTNLSQMLKNESYNIKGYYSFMVHDPKERKIHALHYADRVVQHCLCDEVLAPVLDKRLIYDNAACRIGKGTHFALDRVSGFMRDFYKKHGCDGYFLKCDIRKFFDSIDHSVLKERIRKVIKEEQLLHLLDMIIDSYETSNGKGLPMGNQTSQWFALYYLDGLDRLIKEKLHIKYYSRYMDDFVLIHSDKKYLHECLAVIQEYLTVELELLLNEKTQIFPLKNGVDYLGFHMYLTLNGRVIRKVRQLTKKRYKKSLGYLSCSYAGKEKGLDEIKQVLSSYRAHLAHGDTYKLQKRVLGKFSLVREM